MVLGYSNAATQMQALTMRVLDVPTLNCAAYTRLLAAECMPAKKAKTLSDSALKGCGAWQDSLAGTHSTPSKAGLRQLVYFHAEVDSCTA